MKVQDIKFDYKPLNGSIILIAPPVAKRKTKKQEVQLSRQEQEEVEKERSKSMPFKVVAMCPSIKFEEGQNSFKVGDYVYVSEAINGASVMIIEEPDYPHLNGIITAAYIVNAVCGSTEKWDKKYQAIIDTYNIDVTNAN